MYKVEDKTIIEAYKPFDVVTSKEGSVGFIQEVNVNNCQEHPASQISYSVNWLIGHDRSAWFNHDELERHCNLFVEIAKCACHPSGGYARDVEKIFSLGIK